MKTKKNAAPKVSVLIPAFNAEQYIAESVDSILNQSYQDFELLIINDASTDKTGVIAKSYAKTYPQIKYFENKENKNIAESRNILVDLAKGQYIAWQDADDISVPDRLKLQVEFLEKHHDVGIVGGYLEFFDENGKKSIRKYAPDDESLRKTIFRYSPVAQPVAMIRADALKEVGFYGKDLSPAEDIDMSFRIGTKYRFANISKILLRYRQHLSSSTANKLRKIEIVTLKTRLRFINNQKYYFSLLDFCYNLVQLCTMLLLPKKIRLSIFNIIRNSKESYV